MIRKTVLVLALLAAPLAAEAQGQGGPPPGRPGGQPGRPGAQAGRRAELEAQIFARFMDRVSADMKLDAAGRQRLETQLRGSGERRRALARSTVQLRQQLVRAVQDSTGSDADIQRLLSQLEQLRAQEHELWSSEQQELSRTLTPRQRAVFTLEWLRFNERVREMMMDRRPPPRR